MTKPQKPKPALSKRWSNSDTKLQRQIQSEETRTHLCNKCPGQPEENKTKRRALKAKKELHPSMTLRGMKICRSSLWVTAALPKRFLTEPTAGQAALNLCCYRKTKAVYRSVELKCILFKSLAAEVFQCLLCWPLPSPHTWNHQRWFLFSSAHKQHGTR